MERKEFLKQGFKALGSVAVVYFFNSCTKESGTDDSGSDDDDDDDDSSSGTCSQYPTVTEGPYPTKNPEELVMSDITSDREGTALSIAITIQDYSDNCSVAADVIVDIWHCDAEGNYSQYGGSGSTQTTNYQSVNFLRGRQTTDSSGIVEFTSIYPGWYEGRTTHIHIHAYDSSGNSLVVAQIAFPEDITSTVYAQGAYASHGQKGIANADDNIFSATYESGTLLDIALATVTGSVSSGYTLTHSIAY
ncbi:intradiol ring-cleavage dioxygenase [Parafilimonas sp.]|uniref:dioxygenase family protein n=1 Tax=Parafilimonas sp. TaxID=1969739 RepID=UPI0039E2173A